MARGPILRACLWLAALFGAVAVVLVVGLVGLVWWLKQPPGSVRFEKDIVYRRVDGRDLHLDLARPRAGKGPFPLVYCVHGGGWRGGDRSQFHGALFSLAMKGYVVATVEYRFAPANHFPAQLDDVRAGLRYLRERAVGLQIDPKRVGLVGGSAGGHLVLMLGTTASDPSESVQAVVSFAGPTDLTKPYPAASETMVTDLIGRPRADAPEAYQEASPLNHVGPGDAPVLAIHGTRDELVPYEQATALVDALKAAGVEAELFTIEGGGHGAGGPAEAWKEALVRMVAFLDAHLKTPGTPIPAR